MDRHLNPQSVTATPTLERRSRIQRGDSFEALNRMIEVRVFEEHVQQLFLEGLVRGTTHTCQGQEAICVGVSGVIDHTDRVLCSYRSHGWALSLGTPASSVLAEIMGKSTGCAGGVGGSMHLSDRSVGLWPTVAIVGAQLPIAAGAAMASQIKGDHAVTVAVFGDGAANIGAFHEALNLAAIWKLPVVFLCENNLYGEYSRISNTTAVSDIAARASAYNLPGAIVDGQRVSDVRRAMQQAVDLARGGGGPTLLEAKTYRFVGHSRTDPAKYRPAGELDAWRARDPVQLLAGEIEPEDPDGLVASLREAWETTMGKIVETVKAAPEPPESAMFDHIYARAAT
jgi:TPP-dependent pyruvate/acetoin dehydrogenase alpha subunit